MSGRLIGNLLGGGSPNMDVAKKQLAYPLYGADFDPLNHHFLLVGGGGGSSSTGVPNRISLLDTSNRSEIKEVSDIELASDEDSVTSLAIADSNPTSLLAYAGINSSARDQESGKNEHFRSFSVPLPAKRSAAPSFHSQATLVARTKPLARTAIFRAATGPKNECYQRVLRLSPPIVTDGQETWSSEKAEREPSTDEKIEPPVKRLLKRVTTIASGLATQNEVVTFPATEAPSATTRLISRVNLENAEANDVDLTCIDEPATVFGQAYCTDTALYLQQLSDQVGAVNSEPIQVYETQVGPAGRSRIRALRFLSPRYLLLLQNRVNRSGAELIVLKVSKDFAQVQQVLTKYLKNLKQAVGLDTCTLSKGEDGSQQFVIAVAGQDSSVQIHTLEWVAGKGITKFRQYADAIEVHSGPITRIVFSNFIGPTLPISGKTPPQYIRLATVGVDKNVVVQTLPLKPSPATGTGKMRPRYVLTTPSEIGSFLYNLFIGLIALVVCLLAILSFLEFRGAIPPIVGGTKYLPQRWQKQYGRAYPYAHDNPGPLIPESMPAVEAVIDKIRLSEATPIIQKLEEMQDKIKLAEASEAIESMQAAISSSVPSMPSVEGVKDTLFKLVSRKETEEEHTNKAVIIRNLEHMGGEVSAELRHEAEIVREGTMKRWEHLTSQEKKTWKKKLVEAGQWTEHQGEAVLRGVFFGQLAGVVGQMVG